MENNDGKNYKKYTQDELYILGQKLGERLDELIKHFDLDLIHRPKMYVGSCPIHESDNENAFNLYHTGTVNYSCRTHQCERIFKPTAIGLVRALLSHQNGWRSIKDKDRIVSFPATLEFIEKFLGGEKIEINKEESEKRKFSQVFKNINGYIRNGHTGFTREYIRSKLKIPPKYYIDRGYKAETLDRYDIGLCEDPQKPFFQRIVVPIYDDDYTQIVGYTARSILDRCSICGFYHSKTKECPKAEEKWKYAKWLNNKDFQRDSYLYNYWFAKEHIKKSGTIVLTESPGNVLKLIESGVENVVGIFGTVLTDCQKFIVDCSSANAIFIVGDNDEAGEKSVLNITEKCRKLYSVGNFKWAHSSLCKYNDVGDIPVDIIKKELVPSINKFIDSNKI